MSERRGTMRAVCGLLLCACASCPPPSAAEAPARRAAPAPNPPRGSVVVTPVTVHPGPEGFILFLADETRQRVLPVVIGIAEAQVIDLRIRGEHFERPLTHDLLDTIVRELGGEVVYVHIDKLRSDVFIGSVHIWDGQRMHRIDSRTSDAVAIALGHDAPIYVAPRVLEQAGEFLPPEEPGAL